MCPDPKARGRKLNAPCRHSAVLSVNQGRRGRLFGVRDGRGRGPRKKEKTKLSHQGRPARPSTQFCPSKPTPPCRLGACLRMSSCVYGVSLYKCTTETQRAQSFLFFCAAPLRGRRGTRGALWEAFRQHPHGTPLSVSGQTPRSLSENALTGSLHGPHARDAGGRLRQSRSYRFHSRLSCYVGAWWARTWKG